MSISPRYAAAGTAATLGAYAASRFVRGVAQEAAAQGGDQWQHAGRMAYNATRGRSSKRARTVEVPRNRPFMVDARGQPLKHLDTGISDLFNGLTDSVVWHITGIPRGVDDGERLAACVNVIGVRVNFRLEGNLLTQNSRFVLAIIRDRKPTSVIPAYTDIFDGEDPNEPPNWTNRHRFQVVRRYQCPVWPADGGEGADAEKGGMYCNTAGGLLVTSLHHFYIADPKNKLGIEFEPGSAAGGVSDIYTGAMYIAMGYRTDGMAAGNNLNVFGNVRLTYKDE